VENITLTRSQLYDLVWSEPMLTLSKRYDISDVGLRKICIRFNIPLPKAGHWQKLRYGRKINKVKLTKSFDGPDAINLKLLDDEESSTKNKSHLKVIKDEIKQDLRIEVTIPEKLSKPDKLILAAREKLTNIDRYSRYKDVVTSDRDTIDIRVSKKFISRALRIMDTLIKAFRLRGHGMEVEESGWKAGTYVIVNEQRIKVLLRERLKRVITNNGHWNSSDLYPKGLLFFRIEGHGSREWNDGKTLIEEHISEIIATIEFEGQKMKIREEEWRIEREKRDAEEKIRKQIEDRKARELEDFVELLNKFSRWQQARQLREYLNVLVDNAKVNNTFSKDFESWINRAREKADWFDPIIEKEDEWFEGVDREDLRARIHI
jgi:hypothetical protein